MKISLTADGGLFGYYEGDWYPVNEDRVLNTLSHHIELEKDVTLRSVFLAIGRHPLLKKVSTLSSEVIEDMLDLPYWTKSERQPLKLLALHRQLIAKSSVFTPVVEDEPKRGLMRKRIVSIRRETQTSLSQNIAMSGYHEYPGTRYSLQGIPANTVIEAPLVIDKAALIISDDDQVEERLYDDNVTISDLISAVSLGVGLMTLEGRPKLRIISAD